MATHDQDISVGMRKQIDAAFATSKRRRAAKYACPQCEKEEALLTLSGVGVIIGRLCRFCDYHTFAEATPAVPRPKRQKTGKLVKLRKVAGGR